MKEWFGYKWGRVRQTHKNKRQDKINRKKSKCEWKRRHKQIVYRAHACKYITAYDLEWFVKYLKPKTQKKKTNPHNASNGRNMVWFGETERNIEKKKKTVQWPYDPFTKYHKINSYTMLTH